MVGGSCLWAGGDHGFSANEFNLPLLLIWRSQPGAKHSASDSAGEKPVFSSCKNCATSATWQPSDRPTWVTRHCGVPRSGVVVGSENLCFCPVCSCVPMSMATQGLQNPRLIGRTSVLSARDLNTLRLHLAQIRLPLVQSGSSSSSAAQQPPAGSHALTAGVS